MLNDDKGESGNELYVITSPIKELTHSTFEEPVLKQGEICKDQASLHRKIGRPPMVMNF